MQLLCLLARAALSLVRQLIRSSHIPPPSLEINFISVLRVITGVGGGSLLPEGWAALNPPRSEVQGQAVRLEMEDGDRERDQEME